MTTQHDELTEHVDALKLMKVDDLPGMPDTGVIGCPLCHHDLITIELNYQILEKISTWTVAQLIAWTALQHRSGTSLEQLLERTSGGTMPGIGGALAGDVGTIGVTYQDGFFVGIEPDGYTHS